MISYINVDRTFSEITSEADVKDDSFEMQSYFGISKGTGWNDLLKLNRVIILAKAGAGKTEEIREQTEQLRRQGKRAFFFRLEQLSTDFETAFEIGTLEEFDEWLEIDAPAWFFLDSVDEARLRGAKQFEDAIRRFSVKLSPHKQRAHIYITSRDAVWRPYTDLRFIKDKLPYAIYGEINKTEDDVLPVSGKSETLYSKEDVSEPEAIAPTIFTLNDLNDDQVRSFASAYDVSNLDDFLKAVRLAEAEIYTGRPQDLIELIGYWQKHQKISNHADLIKENIATKLSERDPERAIFLPLSTEDATYGAEMIAAAVTFTHRSRILIFDQSNTPEDKNRSINIQELLKDWDAPKIDAILQRPIFDKAIYSAVRFHHRSEREYLTAKWILRLLSAGHSRKKIESLFFKVQYGVQVVTPSLRPILSWLLIFDEKFHEKVARVAPELFIHGGDPAALSVDIRRAMLIKLCGHYSIHGGRDQSFDINELKRFSRPDLAGTIRQLFEKYSDNENIRHLLLRMIWQGEITSCLDIALNKAIDTSIGCRSSTEHKINKLAKRIHQI